MRPRTLLVLLVVLGGLAAFVYWGIQKPADEKKEKEKTEKKIFQNVMVRNAARVTIWNSKGDLVLEKQGDDWRLSKPIQDLADPTEMKSLMDTLDNLSFDKIVDESPSNLGAFGLAKPKLQVEFAIAPSQSTVPEDKRAEAKAAEMVYTLRVGDRNPDGTFSYIQSTLKPTVYLSSGSFDQYSAKTADDFREKRVVNIDERDATQLEIRTKAGDRLILAREGEAKDAKWMIKYPFEKEASKTEVDAFMLKLTQLRATSFIEGNRAAYNLGQPDVAVKIQLKNEKVDKRNLQRTRPGTVEILLSKKTEPVVAPKKSVAKNAKSEPIENFYAITNAGPAIYQIGKYQYEGLSPTAASFIDKRVVDIKLDEIATIEMKRNDETRMLERRGVGQWVMQQPVLADADAGAVERMLTVLKDLTIKEIIGVGKKAVKDNIPSQSLLSITVTYSKDSSGIETRPPLSVRFGKKLAGGLVTLISNKGETVYSIEDKEMERLWWPIGELQYKKLFRMDEQSENFVVAAFDTSKGKISYKKEKSGYRVQVAPAGGKEFTREITKEPVPALLEKFNALEVKEYLPEEPLDSGLKAPEMTVRVVSMVEGREAPRVFKFGTNPKQTEVYGVMDSKPFYYSVDASKYSELKKALEENFTDNKK